MFSKVIIFFSSLSINAKVYGMAGIRGLTVKLLCIFSLVFSILGAAPVLAAPTTGHGITIITHGFQKDTESGAYLPNWVSEMAYGIKARTGADIPIYRVWYDKQSRGITTDDLVWLCSTTTGGCQHDNVASIDITSKGGAIILLDWAAASNEPVAIPPFFPAYPTQDVADRFFDFLFGQGHNGHNLAELPIHLIGHSRGASLNSRLAYRLAEHGILVDQVTTLDPHPITSGGGIDWVPETFENVIFADNYYRSSLEKIPPSSENLLNPNGQSVVGAKNYPLTNTILGDSVCKEHSQVHAYYYGTIKLSATIDSYTVCAIDDCPIYDTWYQPSTVRSETGYNFSSYTDTLLARPISGLNQFIVGSAGGTRTLVSHSFPSWPNAFFDQRGNFPERVTVGQTVNIPYFYTDYLLSTSPIITFFKDNDTNFYNGDQGAIHDALLSNNSAIIIPASFEWTPTAADVGTYYIGATATNGVNQGVRHDYYLKQITVDPAPLPVITTVPVTITATTPTISEGGIAQFSLCRPSSDAINLSVNITRSGTATAGADYLAPASVQIIPSGQQCVTIQIPTYVDMVAESTESITFTIQPWSGYTLGSPSTDSVQVLDVPPATSTQQLIEANANVLVRTQPGISLDYGSTSIGDRFVVVGTAPNTSTLSCDSWYQVQRSNGSQIAYGVASAWVCKGYNNVNWFDPMSVLTIGNAGGGTVASTPSGISCGTTCSAPFNSNTTVTLTATQDATHQFSGWSGACSNANGSCSVSMTTAKSVVANFGVSSSAITISPASLTFSSQPQGTSSASQIVTVFNTGAATLSGISAVSSSGEFHVSTVTCLGNVAPGQSCTLIVEFAPASTGLRTGYFTITSNAANSPTVSLSGTGSSPLAASISLPSTPLVFLNQVQGTTSASQALTLTNTGTASLSVSNLVPSSGFAVSGNSCGGNVAIWASCTIWLTYTPSAIGAQTGTLNIYSNAASNLTSFNLFGIGVASTPQPMVTAGDNHTLALKSDGNLYGWGWNGYGQLGDNTTSSRWAAVQIGSSYRYVSAGYTHTVAVKSNGTLWVWGDNTYGQLGDNTTVEKHAPVQIGSGYAKVAAGLGHTLALKSDGSLWTWGLNSDAQLGNNSSNNANSLIPVLIGSGYIDIAAGGGHSVGLKSDGTLWTWGGNYYGQLGDGGKLNWGIPKLIGSGYTAIAAGDAHTVALKSGGSLWAWGFNGDGRLGTGNTVDQLSPIQVGTGYASVFVSHGRTLAVKINGELWAIGNPTSLVGSGYVTATVGGFHSVAMKTDGSIWAWGGGNNNGELGNGTYNYTTSTVQVKNDNGSYLFLQSRQLSIGNTGGGLVSSSPSGINCSSSCTADFTPGTVVTLTATPDGTHLFSAWGGACSGSGSCQVTMDVAKSVTGSFTTAPYALTLSPVGLSFTNQASGTTSPAKTVTLTNAGTSTLSINGITSTNAEFSLSANTCGASLPVGANCSFAVSFTPAVSGTHSGAVSVTTNAVGSPHSVNLLGSVAVIGVTPIAAAGLNGAVFAVTGDGTLWGWGPNWYGMVGDGTTTNWLGAVKVGTDFKSVSTSYGGHTLAIKRDGSLWAWGANWNGQLGDGTTTERHSPVQIGVGRTYIAISAGAYHSLAISSDGGLWAWGLNQYGQLGDATTAESHVPIPIDSNNRYIAVTGGYRSSLAIRQDGTLWAVGANSNGVLGDSTTVDKSNWVQVGSGYSSIAMGLNHVAAIKSDGSLWTWGSNSLWQLGDGTTTNRTSPVHIGSSTDNAVVAVGGNFTYVLKSDGAVWAWGSNSNGQFGNGSVTGGSATPVFVGSGYMSIAAGSSNGVGIATDGGVRTWGFNNAGSLGNNLTTNSNSPVAVQKADSTGPLNVYLSLTISNSGGGVITSNPAGINCGSTCSGSFAPGAVITLTATPDSTHLFTGWGGACSGTGTCQVTMNAATSVTANFGDFVPVVNLSPVPVWGNQVLSTASSAKSVTLGNAGTATLAISSIAASGDFAVSSHTCGASLAAESNCTIALAFTPTALGIRGGTLTVTSNAASSPNSTSLSGTGIAPSFMLTVSNGAGGVVSSSPPGINCGANCSANFSDGTPVILTATPDATHIFTGWSGVCVGAQDCAVTMSSARSVTANFIATAPVVGLSNTSLSFTEQTQGTASALQTVTLTNTGTAMLTISSITVLGDFSQNNNCGASVAIGSSCLIAVSFAPTAAGLRLGSLSITSNAVGSPNNVSLSGTGITVSGVPTGVNATAGNAQATVIFIAPANDGGVAIDGYSVTSNSGGSDSNAGSTSLSHVITGLTNGTAYTFTVTAHNSVGNSEPSAASNSVTPRPPGVDLLPTVLSTAAATVVTGTSLAITNTVQNQGGSNVTAASITVNYYLSTDTTITATDKLLGSRTIARAALTAGASSTVTTSYMVPATVLPLGAASGVYYIGAIVDATSAQAETDETNNKLASSGTITVRRAGVDLVPTDVSTSATSILTGSSISITDTVQNQGPSNMTATSILVKYYLSTDTTITATDKLLGQRSILKALMTADGGSSTITSTFPVPATTATGTYYVGAIVDATSLQAETSEANNTRASSTTLLVRKAGVDLVPTAVGTAAASVLTGEGLTVTDTVVNQGTNNMTAVSMLVKYYLSKDTVINATDTLLGQRTVFGSAMTADGGNSTASATYPVPLALTAGAYYVGVIADATNLQAENNETNNTRASNGTVAVAKASIDLISTAVGVNYTQLAAGSSHTVALKDDGTLWAWGSNAAGQLGDGSTTQRNNPVQIGADTDWSALAAGGSHTVALKTNGTLWAWGNNASGQLGDGSVMQQNNPVRVGADTDWLAIAAGGNHTVAFKADGTLWAWGNNASGQLGDGSTTQQNSPIQIGADTDWDVVAAGGIHTVAHKTDGTLWAWGGNASGQLGIGSTAQQTSPVQVGAGTDWADIAAGNVHTVALKSTGALWAWGGNASGQLGDNTTVQRNSPVQIGTGTDWLVVAAGTAHTAAIKSTGALWAWGSNANGRLGDGTTLNRLAPKQIAASGYADVAAGAAYTAALKGDETPWAWGYNATGQLGDGSVMQRLLPVGSIPTMAAGGSLAITDTVKNQGTVTMTAPSFTVKYYLSTDALITATDRLLGQRTISALAAGASDSATTPFIIPLAVPSGTYYIGEMVDTPSAQAETNETNNARAGGKVLVQH